MAKTKKITTKTPVPKTPERKPRLVIPNAPLRPILISNMIYMNRLQRPWQRTLSFSDED